MGETEAISEVQISDVFEPLYTSDARYFFLTGGRASLKSSTVHDFIARLTYEAGHGVLFTRYTMTSAEKSIIPEFKITLERLGLLQDFHITKNIVTNKHTKSFIYFSGIKTSSGDQTATLKSIAGITTWVIEEGEDFNDEKAFDTIDDSIRTASIQNRVIWIQNPTTRDHFSYKRWIEPANRQQDFFGYNVTISAVPGVCHIHSTYHMAEQLGYLSEGWLDKAEKHRIEAEAADDKHTTWYYYNYIGGWLEKAEGAIFQNWIEGDFDTSLPYCYGLDYGYHPDPSTMIKVAVNKKLKHIYLKEEFYETKLSTIGVVSAIREGIEKKHDRVNCDRDLRLYNDIKSEGINIHLAKKGPGSVSRDISDMQDYQIIIDPDSHNLKKEANKYVWNDKKSSIPIDAWNHAWDASRYGFRFLVPAKGNQISMSGRNFGE